MIDATPTSYAQHLATYIACPVKIHSLTRHYFGRAPALEQCRYYRSEVERQRDGFKRLANRVPKDKPKFPCGHNRTEDNTTATLAGDSRCMICNKRRQAAAHQRRKLLKAIETRRIAEREARAARIAELTGLMRADPDCPAKELAMIAAAVFNTTYPDVMSKSRDRYHIRARFAVYLVGKERGISFAGLGRSLGRDHSSVINGHRRATAWIAAEPDYAEKVAAVRKVAGL